MRIAARGSTTAARQAITPGLFLSDWMGRRLASILSRHPGNHSSLKRSKRRIVLRGCAVAMRQNFDSPGKPGKSPGTRHRKSPSWAQRVSPVLWPHPLIRFHPRSRSQTSISSVGISISSPLAMLSIAGKKGRNRDLSEFRRLSGSGRNRLRGWSPRAPGCGFQLPGVPQSRGA